LRRGGEGGGFRADGGRAMKKGDIALLASVVAAACLLALVFSLQGRGGDRAVISVDGVEYRTIPLARDSRVEIDVGGKQNVVAVEDGAVYMHSANCPDKLCVRQGRISRGDQSIVCLPNRVTVRIAKPPAGTEPGGSPAPGGDGYGDVDAVAS
jgi:hypothetical protein